MSNKHLPTSTSTLRVDVTGAEIVNEDDEAPPPETSDIYLPKHTEFISHIALDIGGSLAKIVYFTRAFANKSSSVRSLPRPQEKDSDQGNFTEPSESSSSDKNGKPSEKIKDDSGDRNGSVDSEKVQPIGILKPTLVKPEIQSQTRSNVEDENDQEPSNQKPSTVDDPKRVDRIKSSAEGGDDDDQGGEYAESVGKVQRKQPNLTRATSLSSLVPGGRLNFTKFETESIESECIPFINNLIETSARSNEVEVSTMKRSVKVILTGGGAYMYFDRIKDALGGDVEVLREEEMECLIIGLNFLTEIPNEVFWFSDELVQEIVNKNPNNPSSSSSSSSSTSALEQQKPQKDNKSSQNDGSNDTSSKEVKDSTTTTKKTELLRPSPNPPQYSVIFDSDSPSYSKPPQFPCLLVNIGSGVSIIKVTSFKKFERISGTSLGGGTLWGLLSLLTDAKSFDEMLDLSLRGDNSKVDMLVGDIYGQDYEKIGLKSSVIASSFGKVFKKREMGLHNNSNNNSNNPNSGNSNSNVGEVSKKDRFSREDISKSLLYAISNNIGQIANLNAEQHNLDRIYFGGCFIRGHVATVSTLSYAIRFWSRGSKRAYFLRHEGYLGSIGAWLKNISDEK